MGETMTYAAARGKLKRYYLIQELAHDYHLRSTDIIIAVGRSQPSETSPEETEVIRRVDLLASVKETREALGKLPGEYQEFLALRFNKQYSLRQAGREVHMGLGTAQRFEIKALSAFIAALGKIPAA